MRLVNGVGAGWAATLAMSAFMRGARGAGVVGELPPHKLTRRTLSRLGVHRTRVGDELSSVGAHFAYGGAAGAFYERALRGRVFRRQPVVEGMLFGALVYAASYLGWVPALRLMPPPTRDHPGRTVTMIAAHLLFGAVLGAVARRKS